MDKNGPVQVVNNVQQNELMLHFVMVIILEVLLILQMDVNVNVIHYGLGPIVKLVLEIVIKHKMQTTNLQQIVKAVFVTQNSVGLLVKFVQMQVQDASMAPMEY
jgi:hypothetical protein